jgi:hypothetical protein
MLRGLRVMSQSVVRLPAGRVRRGRPRPLWRILAGAVAAIAGAATPARAQDDADTAPPPINVHYLQYGVAFVAESVASAGDVCPPPDEAKAPCILGSGVGLAVRVGYRSRGPWYVGGAYEFSRQDSSNLLRIAILQQLRAESRFYFEKATRMTPYLATGLGAAFYGDEWGTDTGGVTTFLGGGLEFQITQSAVVGAALVYRPLLLRGWSDEAGQRRADQFLGFGLAHLVALELVMELRDPLARW